MPFQINATTPDLRQPISTIPFPCTVMHRVEQIAARGNQLYTVSSGSDGLRFYRISFEGSMPPPEGFPQVKFDWDHTGQCKPALPFFMVQDRLCLFEGSGLSCRDIKRPAEDDSDKLVLGAGKIVAAIDHLGCVIQLTQKNMLKFCLFTDTAPHAFENLHLHWESIGRPGQPKAGLGGWYEKCSVSLLRFDRTAAFGISEAQLELPEWPPGSMSGPFAVDPNTQTHITVVGNRISYNDNSRLESPTGVPPKTITGCQLRGNVLASILDGSLVTWDSPTRRIIKVLTPNSLHLTDSVTLVDFRLLESHLILLDSADTLTVYPLFQDLSINPTRSISTGGTVGPTPISNEEQQALVEVQRLIAAGTINETDMRGKTHLHLAANKGHANVVELLIKAGVNLNARDRRGVTPLLTAIERQRVYIVKLLTEAKADLSTTINTIDRSSQTPLHIAAELGGERATIIRLLIKAGANLDATDRINRTPLHAAADKGHADVVELLIEAKANLNEKDINGQTPLHRAARKGHTNVIGLLIKAGGSLNATDEFGRTPLHLAADKGHAGVVELLIEEQANFNAEDGSGQTPMHYAAQKGHADVVKLLTEAKAELNTVDQFANMPLHHAAYYGNTAIAKRLIRTGANLNATDENGKTPLHYAAEREYIYVVKLLIKAKANLNATDKNGKTPLHLAAGEGHADIAELLIEAGANLDATDGFGQTPLHAAAEEGHANVVELLIKAKAGLNDKDFNAQTPLYIAIKKGDADIAYLLFDAEVDLSTTHANGRTLLHLAADKGHADIVTLLIEAKADLNAVDGCDQTPLHIAAAQGHTNVVKLLIGAKANLNAVDGWDQTPLHIAARNGHATVVTLLKAGRAGIWDWFRGTR